MISCQTFRSTLVPGSDDPSSLEHLRTCDACLDYAVSVDPDYLFRSMGGSELVPAGGVDAFVSDVMAQVRVRQTESVAHRLPLNRYLRAAAAVLLMIAGTAGIYRFGQEDVVAPLSSPVMRAAITQPTTTKAVVESYESQNATIVEVPSAPASDTKIVMIYDESLPADL